MDSISQSSLGIQFNTISTAIMSSVTGLNDAKPPEQLFLDLPVQQVLQADGLQPVEPWASMYIDAIHDGRFGDAIWARYHIMGNVVDGVIDGRLTVLESIEEDAMGYKASAPVEYAQAVSFYRGRVSSKDGRVDIIEIIFRVGREVPKSV